MPNYSTIAWTRVFDPVHEQIISEQARKRYLVENRQKVMRSVGMLSLCASIAIPLFSLLDYFTYPDLFVDFLILRFLCVACVLAALFVCLKTRIGKRCYRAFIVIVPLIPAFFIALMIYKTADPFTSYYIGMILCVVVIGFISHWTFSEALIASSLVLLFYFLAITPPIFNGIDVQGKVLLLSNCIFAFAFGAVITLGTLLQQKICREEFFSREKVRQQKVDLAAKNAQLAATMSELRRTEGQLIQSEKMASLGELSAGVIHEIGNPLNYSNQALFLLKKLLKDHGEGSHVREAIDDIQDSFDRMKVIVTELREFSHKSSEVKIEFKLLDSVDVAVRMLGKEIADSKIEVDVSVDPALRVEAVKNQITQVLVNLIHNALQAIAKSEDDSRERFVRIFGRRLSDSIELIVLDNGPGIAPENRKQLFDPFFTTKQAGEGTGLGLSICYRIIESHGGSISVDSEPGEFTKFTISLPLPQSASEAVPPTTKNSQPIAIPDHAIS